MPAEGFTMEREALVLRARAEQAKLAAHYATNDLERRQYEDRARAFEAQARQIEDRLDPWTI
jgi:acyl-CoA reductase-like NAD-dependent aldehyde dehydrogenase